MKKIFTLAALLTLNFSNTYAQGLDTTQWFPYKTGNMWEYTVWEELTPVDTLQSFIVHDSTDGQGIIHITQFLRNINPIQQESINKFYLDTVNNFIYGKSPDLDSVLLYKLNAQIGDQWVIFSYSIGGYELARVMDKYQEDLYGTITTFMVMNYYGAADSTDTLGLDRHSSILAKGFGIYMFGGGETFLRNFLHGAIIDNILYGDTTHIILSVEDDKDLFISDVRLSQNYPNPFNPTTKIKYTIPSTVISGEAGNLFVTLKVYDVIGKEITTLVNEEKPSGNFEVEYDGSNLSSGVYIYRLTATGRNSTYKEAKQMTLVK